MEWQGLNQLYDRYRHELLVYLYTLCSDTALAEDLLQETFLKAYFSLPQQHGNVRAWLYLVAWNLYFDHCKKSNRLCSETDAIPTDSCPSPEESVIDNEKFRTLHQAMQHLDPRKREILAMQYFGGMSCREIGAVLKIRPDHVRVLSSRARKELKAVMEEAGYELP